MPNSALPDYLKPASNWKGTDWDNKWQRWLIPFKGWFAYGPRATQWWARWREFPKTLFAVRSKQGVFRVETESWERDSSWDNQNYETKIVNEQVDIYGNETTIARAYLTRIQYYTRWHFQVQWPLMVSFHFYTKSDYVPEYGFPRPDTDGKLWFCYFGAARDGDKVYWFPSAYLGRNWK